VNFDVEVLTAIKAIPLNLQAIPLHQVVEQAKEMLAQFHANQ